MVPVAQDRRDPPGESPSPLPDHQIAGALRGPLPGPGLPNNQEALAEAKVPPIQVGHPAQGIGVEARARARARARAKARAKAKAKAKARADPKANQRLGGIGVRVLADVLAQGGVDGSAAQSGGGAPLLQAPALPRRRAVHAKRVGGRGRGRGRGAPTRARAQDPGPAATKGAVAVGDMGVPKGNASVAMARGRVPQATSIAPPPEASPKPPPRPARHRRSTPDRVKVS